MSQKLIKKYRIAQVILCISPFVYLLYLELLSFQTHSSLNLIIQKYPLLVIGLITSMLYPYIAYLFNIMIKHQYEIQDYLLNYVFLIVGTLLTGNVFYLVLIIYLFIQTLKDLNISIKRMIHKYTLSHLFQKMGGSLIILLLNSICFMALYRIV